MTAQNGNDWYDFLELLQLVGVAPADPHASDLWQGVWEINEGASNEGGVFRYRLSSLRHMAQEKPGSFAAKAYNELIAHNAAKEAPQGPPAGPVKPAAPTGPAQAMAPAEQAAPAPAEVPQTETKDEAQNRLAQALGRPTATAADMPPIGEAKGNAGTEGEEAFKKKRKRRTKAQIHADKIAAEEKEKEKEKADAANHDAATASDVGDVRNDSGSGSVDGAAPGPQQLQDSGTPEAVTAGHDNPGNTLSADAGISGAGAVHDKPEVKYPQPGADLPDLSNVPTAAQETVQMALDLGSQFAPKNLKVLKESHEHFMSQQESRLVAAKKKVKEQQKALADAEAEAQEIADILTMERVTLRLISQLEVQ